VRERRRLRRLLGHDDLRHPAIAAGGIGGAADLDVLRAAGAAGAVVGMALYTGDLTADAALAPPQGERR
jgi:phosphoribosylformimino-5-aminoimidazole carboxamide ribonucleotide (ProFAR) isomerase